MKLIHYSNKNLQTVNPKYQGTGHIGAEKKRAINDSPYYVPRSWWYTKRGKKEAELGNYRYSITMPDSAIYDFMADKDLSIKIEALKLAKNEGISITTALEYIVKKKGYSGLYSQKREVVILFYHINLHSEA